MTVRPKSLGSSMLARPRCGSGLDPGVRVWQTIPDPRCVGLALGPAAMPDPRCLCLKVMHDLTTNKQIEQLYTLVARREKKKKKDKQSITNGNSIIICLHAPHHVKRAQLRFKWDDGWPNLAIGKHHTRLLSSVMSLFLREWWLWWLTWVYFVVLALVFWRRL